VRSKKRLVYIVATLTAMVVFLPFQSQPWSIYAGACAGYTVLVFGLQRINSGKANNEAENAKPASGVVMTHLSFLLIVVAWVWLCIFLRPYLPYFLTMEDTRRPYFGLAFLGIIGLMCLEFVEQRWLRLEREVGVSDAKNVSMQQSETGRK
jgi:hypothetical protein